MKYRESSWLRAVEYSLRASLALTVLLSFIASFTVFAENHEHYYQYAFNFIAIFFGLIFYVGLGSLIITLVSVGVLGAPTVWILKQFDIVKPFYAALVGAICVYLFMFASEGRLKLYFLFFSFYGFICGYAFIKGYYKGAKK